MFKVWTYCTWRPLADGTPTNIRMSVNQSINQFIITPKAGLGSTIEHSKTNQYKRKTTWEHKTTLKNVGVGKIMKYLIFRINESKTANVFDLIWWMSMFYIGHGVDPQADLWGPLSAGLESWWLAIAGEIRLKSAGLHHKKHSAYATSY